MNKDHQHKDFNAPSGYFEQFPERMSKKIEEEELRFMAPVLASLERKEPFEAPAGYFEKLTIDLNHKTKTNTEGKVIPLWKKYAAIAASLAILLTAGTNFLNLGTAVASMEDVSLAEVSTSELIDFVEEEVLFGENDIQLNELFAEEKNDPVFHKVSEAGEESLEEYLIENASWEELEDEL